MKSLVVALGLLVVACSSHGPSRAATDTGDLDHHLEASAAATTVSTPPVSATSFTSRFRPISGPLPQSTAFTGNLVSQQFVLDSRTEEVFTVNGGGATAWIDDTTLIAPFYSQTRDRGYHLLRLDGTDTFVDAPPPTPTPYEIQPISADREWQVIEEGANTYVEQIDGQQRIAVPSHETFAWAPRGHVLAIGGGRCGNIAVSFVDPDSSPSVRAIDVGSAIPRSYRWRPDGSGIALALIGGRSRIVFAEVANATTRVLAPLAPASLGGEPIPGPWSPSGTYLLFWSYYGRPCPG